jgi:hypothetical protein
MEKELILRDAAQIFENVSPVGDQVYRGELNIDSPPFNV